MVHELLKNVHKAVNAVKRVIADMFTALEVEKFYEEENLLERIKTKKVILHKEGWPTPYSGWVRSFTPNHSTGSYTVRLETDDPVPKIVYATWWELHVFNEGGTLEHVLNWRSFGPDKPSYTVRNATAHK